MKKTTLAFAAYMSLTGCASIIGEPSQVLPITSSPSEANIIITDETGQEIFKGNTPTTVNLQKSDGSYFGGKSFVVNITKDGYKAQSIPVKSNANGWYIGGNLIFGGLIGWLVVDPLNGNMYKLSPEAVSSNLGQETAHNNKADGAISVVLLDDVPEHLLSQMQPLR